MGDKRFYIDETRVWKVMMKMLMSKFASLFVANLIVTLGQVFAATISFQKWPSFGTDAILLFMVAFNIYLIIIFFILIAIEHLILKVKSWILWIVMETILMAGFLLLVEHSLYFIALLLLTQYIKYWIYNQYKSKKKKKKDE